MPACGRARFAVHGVIGGGAFGYSDAETLLLNALREIRLTQLDSASKTMGEWPGRYPNYRLAHLVQGDLWLAKSRAIVNLSNSSPTRHMQQTNFLSGQRAEASARVHREKDAFKPEQISANFWRVPAVQPFALVVDVDKSRLYVLANENGRLVRVADFYAPIGKVGGG